MATYKITAHFDGDLPPDALPYGNARLRTALKAKLYRCVVEIAGDRLGVPEQYYAVLEPTGDVRILRKPIADSRHFVSTGLRYLEELADLNLYEIAAATKAAIKK